mmetsp:Transcript_20507/g.32833  ORF Transcript_20507/g.32833 Transcript_20507/m.32833 type:complete len:216 (-) Transcript_20507:53-700(-)
MFRSGSSLCILCTAQMLGQKLIHALIFELGRQCNWRFLVLILDTCIRIKLEQQIDEFLVTSKYGAVQCCTSAQRVGFVDGGALCQQEESQTRFTVVASDHQGRVAIVPFILKQIEIGILFKVKHGQGFVALLNGFAPSIKRNSDLVLTELFGENHFVVIVVIFMRCVIAVVVRIIFFVIASKWFGHGFVMMYVLAWSRAHIGWISIISSVPMVIR